MRAAILALFLTAADGPPPAAPEQPLRARMQPGQTFVCRSPGGCYIHNGPGLELMIRQVTEDVRGQCSLQGI